MKAQQTIDNTLDPFFKRHGRAWLLATDIVGGVGVPLAVLAMVLFGTHPPVEAGDTISWRIDFYYIFVLYALILLASFGRYTRRYQRETYARTLKFMQFSASMTGAIIILSLPSMPLAPFWHLPSPATNLILLATTEIPLLAGIAGLWWEHRKAVAKPFR